MAAHKTGGDVDAHCNKCKLTLAHVIIAMNGTRIAKVECKTCRGVHAYKAGPGSSAASPRRASTGTRTTKGKGSASIGPSDYEKVIKGQDLSRAQRYRASTNFAEGDVVDHTNFGLGIITRLLADSKIEVLFPIGMKVLVHSRTA
jgi:hypothetical protein